MCKESPPADDQHSDGDEGTTGRCWFDPRGRGRWRFARLRGKAQSKWRVSPLTRLEATEGSFGDSCCCSPRWGRSANRAGDGDQGSGVAVSAKGYLLRNLALCNDASPGFSPLPARTVSNMESDKEREAFVPLWQRRASMAPIKALDLRYRTS